MQLSDVRRKAFAMPLNDPAYPPGPYKFYNREFIVITYRTDPDELREVVPEPLEVAGDTVAGALQCEGRHGPGRRLCPRHASRRRRADRRRARDLGLSKEAGEPENFARRRRGRMHPALRLGPLRLRDDGFQASRNRPGAVVEGVRAAEFHDQDHPACRLHAADLRAGALLHGDVTLKGAWAGPAAIQLFAHAMCDVARLPVREVVSATHYITDLTLGLGEVVFDYMKDA